MRVVAGTGDTTAAALGAGAVEDHAPHLYVGTSAWLTCHVPGKKTDVFRNIASMPPVVPHRYWVATIQNVAGKATARWMLDAVEHFTGKTGPRGLAPIRFIGGGATSRLWCQTMAGILRRPICQVGQPAAANARGAALLAGIAIGETTWAQIPALATVTERFEPDDAHRDTYDQAYAAFRRHYRANRAIYAALNS